MNDNQTNRPNSSAPAPRVPLTQRLIAYITGGLALLVVAAATGSAVTYVVMNGVQTLSLLGNAALNGIGMAVGGCLGSALVLRFKSARRVTVHTPESNEGAGWWVR